MQTSDHSKFFQFICNLPNQIAEAPAFLKNLKMESISKKYDKIVLTGMGGSAIVGDLLKSYLQAELEIPFIVNRNYTLPHFVGKNTLVLACSYSGDTEETINSTKMAIKRKATIIGLASGGELEKLMNDHSYTFIKIPGGYPPRQALGYMFFPLLNLFQHLGLIGPKNEEINETITVLSEIRERSDPTKIHIHNLSNLIAQKLYKKIPVIYTAAEFLYPVVTRWRNQFNENSKVLAFSNVLPELNHNEIMGWEAPPDVLQNFNILFLRDEAEFSRNQKRLEISKDIFHKNQVPIFEIFAEGKSLLARIFSLIYIGDWVSYYLALLYKKDPQKIDSIQLLKDTLSAIKDDVLV
jgi:glucose/mannose-6-phosphate isomerase